MTDDEERLRRAAAFVGAGPRRGECAPQVDTVLDGRDRVGDAHRHPESGAGVGMIVPSA